MEFIEFLELIGRFADCAYAEEEIPFHAKINLVLDQWFTLIGESRSEPKYYYENTSDEESN